MEKIDLKVESQDEANDLLQNGIFVETDSGLLCVPLNEALLFDLNLSVEALHDVASQLILQEDGTKLAPKTTRDPLLYSGSFNMDSDGFSSECSDISSYSAHKIPTTQTLEPIKSMQLFLSDSLKPIRKTENDNISEKIAPAATVSKGHENILVPTHSSSDISATSNVSDSDTSVANFSSPTVILSFIKKKNNHITTNDVKVGLPSKRRGGWPKGRKRKPELLNLPPKAPATGYNLYLNEQRELYKDSRLAFHEITKIIGNKWSSLTLGEKQPYLAKAEEDKKRYREELHKYRQSDAYRAYLNKKRKNRLQNNVLSESDMDATDEIDEEDNEELYCRTCDQWFHNLHNKREHLQGRQHTQSIAGDMKKELGMKYKSGWNRDLKENEIDSGNNSVSETITQLVSIVAKREQEINSLKCRLEESQLSQKALWQQLCSLNQRQLKLNQNLQTLKEEEKNIESKLLHLLKAPNSFPVEPTGTKLENNT